MSYVIFLSGSMFGKKSKKLIDFINFSKEKKSRYIVYKPTNDTRDGLFVKSRDYEQTIPALPWDVNDESHEKYDNFIKNIRTLSNPFRPKLLFFDEIHFLPVEDIIFIINICKNHKVALIVSGLETDFRQDMFPSAEYLKKVATNYYFLNGTCKQCGSDDAIYNILYDNNGNRVTEGDSIQPGDEEYGVLCKKCFN